MKKEKQSEPELQNMNQFVEELIKHGFDEFEARAFVYDLVTYWDLNGLKSSPLKPVVVR